jgi:hypothetical protein
MLKLLLLFTFYVLSWLFAESFSILPGKVCLHLNPKISSSISQSTSQLWFKKGNKKSDDDGQYGGDDGEEGNQSGGSWFQGLKRFMPAITRARMDQKLEPEPNSRARWHLRLVSPISLDRRHIITRLTRFLPDLTWETAADIVDMGIRNGKSLIRMFQSREQAEEISRCLLRADPPVHVELYDEEEDEVVI